MTNSSSPPLDQTGEWTPEQLREALVLASDWAAEYRAGVRERPIVPAVQPGDIAARLGDHAPDRPAPFADVLREFRNTIVPGLTHWNHPGFMAYFCSSSRGASVAAELLVAAVGVNAMLWRTSPAATEVETTAVKWLRECLGLPAAYDGLILDTASTSTFTAVLAARERATARHAGAPLAVYASEQAHSSVDKSVMAAGIGRTMLRHVECDHQLSMRPAALREAMRRDAAAGIAPAMVVGTIGTTSTAAVDPIDGVADVASEHGAWLHIDAAYAGPAAMLPEQRHRFTGWQLADSIVLNPHKWLATSLDCSVLLYRDAEAMRAPLALTPAYLETGTGAEDLMEIGLPLGRRFRGLKLWVLFKCVGTENIRNTLRGHIAMAESAARKLTDGGLFELVVPPSFGTVCFRTTGDDPVAEDRRSRAVMAQVNATGGTYVSHTVLGERYVIRLSVGSVHTTPRDLDAAVTSLRAAAAATAG